MEGSVSEFGEKGAAGCGRSERPCQPRALVDRAQCVELFGHVGAADQVGGDAARAQLVVQGALALLAGADDHAVDGECARFTVARRPESSSAELRTWRCSMPGIAGTRGRTPVATTMRSWPAAASTSTP